MDGESGSNPDGEPRTETQLEMERRQSRLLWDIYRRFHETAPIGYFTLGADNRIIDVNLVGVNMLGARPRELLGRKLTAYLVGPTESCYESFMNSILERDEWQECELELRRTDGSTFFAVLQGREIAPTDEIVIFATDITERRRTEDALRESERRYRELSDMLAEGIFEADSRGILSYANHRLIDAFGINESDFHRVSVFEFVAAQDRNLARERFTSIVKGEDLGPQEYLLQRRDGTTFPALVHSLAVWRNDTLAGIRSVVFDISERKRAEADLKESERKYRELAELLGAGIYEADATGAITYANRKGMAIFGLSEDDLKNGLSVFDVIVPQDLNAAGGNFARVLKQEDLGPVEYTLKRMDGTTFPALTYSSAVMRDGMVVGVRGVAIDISELKRAEQALRDSEKKYRELTDLLDEGVFELDLNGRFTYANRKGMSYLGIDERDLTDGLTVFDIVVRKDWELAGEKLAGAVNGADTGPVEFAIVRKDGTTFPALTHGSAITREGAVVGIRGVLFDISDLKRAELALRESEERLRTTLDGMLEGCLILDFNWRCLYANDAVAQQGQFTREQWVGRRIMDLIPEMENTQGYAQLKEAMEQRVPQKMETELTYPNGSKGWFEVSIEPVPEGILMLYLNITERKLAEEHLKKTMAELDRSNKELEQFAYVTSHDLREPLRMMTSFAQSLEKRYKDKLDRTADEYIYFIVDGASRMQRLIDDILVYSRVTTRGLPFEQVEMEKVFQDALANLRASIEETEAVITHEALPVVRADPSQMVQVMQNLIGNAIKFHREGEPPVVHVSASREGREWIFAVKDNGIGMDPELFGRLFNLFQRLNPPDKYPGTGVGLAVTKKIVQRHGGQIWVESEPERGSTFYFSMPL